MTPRRRVLAPLVACLAGVVLKAAPLGDGLLSSRIGDGTTDNTFSEPLLRDGHPSRQVQQADANDRSSGSGSTIMTVIIPAILGVILAIGVAFSLWWYYKKHLQRGRADAANRARSGNLSAEELAQAPLTQNAQGAGQSDEPRQQRRRRGLNLEGGLGRSESGSSYRTLPEYKKEAGDEERVLLRRDPSLSSRGHGHQVYEQDVPLSPTGHSRRVSELSVVSEGMEGGEVTAPPTSWGAAPSYDMGYEYGFGDVYDPPSEPPPTTGAVPARTPSGKVAVPVHPPRLSTAPSVRSVSSPSASQTVRSPPLSSSSSAVAPSTGHVESVTSPHSGPPSRAGSIMSTPIALRAPPLPPLSRASSVSTTSTAHPPAATTSAPMRAASVTIPASARTPPAAPARSATLSSATHPASTQFGALSVTIPTIPPPPPSTDTPTQGSEVVATSANGSLSSAAGDMSPLTPTSQSILARVSAAPPAQSSEPIA